MELENEETQSAPAEASPYAAPAPPYAPQSPGSVLYKSPGIATILSLMPGLGHIYNGLYQRGLIFFALVGGAMTLAAATELPPFGVVAFFFWLFSGLDAYRQARLINHGYTADLGLLDQPRKLKPGQGALATGIVLIVGGTLELLSRYGIWNWRWMEQLWPLILIVIGAVLVWMWLREKTRGHGEEPADAEAPEIL